MEKETKSLLDNVKELKTTVRESVRRYKWPPKSDRERSQAIFQNFFLHIQSARIHKYSLKPSFSMGLGIATFFLFLILCVTGVFLMVYYIPSTKMAYDNVRDISFVVGTGHFMRNLHRWAAHGMVIAVMLHMLRVFYTGAYKRTRKFNWVLGMAMFCITLLLSYTGYLLPWDQLAFWAVTIGANIAASPRELTDAIGMTQYFDVGGIIKNLLIGGNVVGQEALTRFYLLHVIFLPAILFALIGVHFWRVRKDGGLAKPDNADEIIMKEEGIEPPSSNGSPVVDTGKTYGLMALIKDKTPHVKNSNPDCTVMTWPVGIWAEIGVFMLTLSIMTLLSYFFDAPLKEIANPAIPENPAKAPWYFLGLQELISYSAFMGGIGIPTIVLVGLTLIPYLDREEDNIGFWFSGDAGRKLTINTAIFTTVFTIALLAFTVEFGWLRNWFPDVPQLVIVFVNPGSFIVLVYAWWSVHVFKKYKSTRMAAIALFTSFAVGFIILTIMGTYFRGPNWDFFWSPSQWPIH